MSSIDQAFVKAFARRNRSSQLASPSTPTSPGTEAIPPASARETPPKAARGSQGHNDFLRIDPTVDASVEITLDPREERLIRLDAQQNEPVPAPHAPPKTQKIKPESSVSPMAPIHSNAETNHTAPPVIEDSLAIEDSQAQVEKFTQHARSIQASLDLLQNSFTTLETSQQPSGEIAKAYDPVAVSAPLQTPVEIETHESDKHANNESAEVAQRRFDPPAVDFDYTTNPSAKTPKIEVDEYDSSSIPAASLHLRPVWEVDVFDVPSAVADLFFEGPLFQQIAERVLQAVNSGLNSMMVSSVHRGEGRSTVAIGMAMAAAAAGLRVALVDADTEDPTLQDDLRLDLEYGWVDTVRGGLAIREVAVHAIEDGVTLIPMMPPQSGAAATDHEIEQVLQSLSGKFDLIVIDTPSLESSMSLPAASMVDSALIVRDASRTDVNMINKLSYKLREKGVEGIGVVDNFA